MYAMGFGYVFEATPAVESASLRVEGAPVKVDHSKSEALDLL